MCTVACYFGGQTTSKPYLITSQSTPGYFQFTTTQHILLGVKYIYTQNSCKDNTLLLDPDTPRIPMGLFERSICSVEVNIVPPNEATQTAVMNLHSGCPSRKSFSNKCISECWLEIILALGSQNPWLKLRTGTTGCLTVTAHDPDP